MSDEAAEPPLPVVPTVGVPSLYCNGFNLIVTNTDIHLLLMVDNNPQMNLHLSFTSAKTMGFGLNQAIKQLEKITGRKIMMSTDIAEAIAKAERDTVSGQ